MFLKCFLLYILRYLYALNIIMDIMGGLPFARIPNTRTCILK